MEREKKSGASWLAVLGHVDGLRWVIKSKRMAFTKARAFRAKEIRAGDELFLYVSAAAFGKPTSDSPQLIGVARVASPVREIVEPFVLAERLFVCECSLDLKVIFPEREGVPFLPLVFKLSFIKDKQGWGAYVRSSPIRLPTRDALVLSREIEKRSKRRTN